MPDTQEPKLRRPRRTLQEREAALQADLIKVREAQSIATKRLLQQAASDCQTLATKLSGQAYAKLIAQAAQLLTQASNEIKVTVPQ